MTNFRISLSSRRRTKNLAGEFVRHVRNGAEREDIESWPQLQAYIYRNAHADKVKEPIPAAEPIWTGYRFSRIARPFGERAPEADVEGAEGVRIEYPLQAI
jgi:hypothetical protein